jgi:hypothetical protein
MIFGLTPYHIGVCVGDLDGEWLAVADRFGIHLGEPVHAACPLRTADGIESVATLRSAWSKGIYPALEVTQALPGTIWTAGQGIHHFGVWAEDLRSLTERCLSAGARMELEGSVDGQLAFRYLHMPGGVRIELVDASMKPYIDRITATG